MSTHLAATPRLTSRAVRLSPKQKCYIGAAGAFGSILATLADIIQKEQASAVTKLAEALQTTLRISVSPLHVLLLLVVLAIGLCFVFAVETTKSAFYRGASVLALLMTIVPYKIPPSIPTNPNLPDPNPASDRLDEFFIPAVYAQTPVAAQQRIRVEIHLTSNDGKNIQGAVYTLISPTTKGIIARSKVQGSDFSFY